MYVCIYVCMYICVKMYVCTNVCICGFVTHMICGSVCWCAWYACVGTTVCMWCSVAQCHDVLLFGVCGDIFATVDVDVASRMNYCFACVSPDLRICSFDCWHFLGLTPMVSSPLSGWSWQPSQTQLMCFLFLNPGLKSQGEKAGATYLKICKI